MAKKLTVLLIVAILVAACCVSFTACNKDDPVTIVFIGDSIAEALIGPSPLAERDNYGYYAIVGKTNNYRYFNHSVSGHKTSTNMLESAEDDENDIGGLLGMLTRDDENAALMKSHLQQADIIHISVLGNNILQYNLGWLLYEIAQPDFESKFDYGKGTTLLDLLYTGSRDPMTDSNGEYLLDEHGRIKYFDYVPTDQNTRPSLEKDGEIVQFNFPPTYRDIVDIIARIRQLNPTAHIIFQTVYNPFYEGSVHLHEPVRRKVAEITDVTGRFGEPNAKLEDISQLRAIAGKLLDYLNHMIDMYIEEYNPDPKTFHKLDINAAFERVTQMDKTNGKTNLSEDCLGRQLIYQDWTHPSNLGHAIIASETQKLLDEIGISDPNALANFKALRTEQLNRLYKDSEGADLDQIAADIQKANDFEGVAFAYYYGVKDLTPANY